MRLDADDFLHADALLVMTAEIQKDQKQRSFFQIILILIMTGISFQSCNE